MEGCPREVLRRARLEPVHSMFQNSTELTVRFAQTGGTAESLPHQGELGDKLIWCSCTWKNMSRHSLIEKKSSRAA